MNTKQNAKQFLDNYQSEAKHGILRINDPFLHQIMFEYGQSIIASLPESEPSKPEIEKLAEIRNTLNRHLNEFYQVSGLSVPSKIRSDFSDKIMNMFQSACQGGDEWVSVKDRLPEHNQKVLFWTYYKNQTVDVNMKMGLFLNQDQWGRVRFCDGAFHSVNEVTHWQPLPQPPVVKP